MSAEISVEQLLAKVRELPEDEPIDNTRKWYRTQKEHWIGWLKQYRGPGAYGRVGGNKRDAKFVYNHIVEPKMLLYLIRAAGVDARLMNAAEEAAAAASGATLMAQSAAVRRTVPWTIVREALWD